MVFKSMASMATLMGTTQTLQRDKRHLSAEWSMSRSVELLPGIPTSSWIPAYPCSSGHPRDVRVPGRGLQPSLYGVSCFPRLTAGSSRMRSSSRPLSSKHVLLMTAVTRSRVCGAAELTAGPSLARRLPVAYRCTLLAEMQTYLPKVITLWARASQMLWPFPLELVCQKVLPRRGIHSVVSACPPHMLP